MQEIVSRIEDTVDKITSRIGELKITEMEESPFKVETPLSKKWLKLKTAVEVSSKFKTLKNYSRSGSTNPNIQRKE